MNNLTSLETIKEFVEKMKVPDLPQEDFLTIYADTNKLLIKDVSQLVANAELQSSIRGIGTIIDITGDSFENLALTVKFNNEQNQFTDELKKYSLKNVATVANQTKFVDSEIVDTYLELNKIIDEINVIKKEQENKALQDLLDSRANDKKEARIKETCLKAKQKAIDEFNAFAAKDRDPITQEEAFYVGLGWLASHIGTISAAMPDYLIPSFKKYFGQDAPFTSVNSNDRTANGDLMKRTWSFGASLLKVEENTIPYELKKYISPSGKSIFNTTFIWDLVTNCGFRFGKQDKAEIVKNIPPQFKDSFEAGFTS